MRHDIVPWILAVLTVVGSGGSALAAASASSPARLVEATPRPRAPPRLTDEDIKGMLHPPPALDRPSQPPAPPAAPSRPLPPPVSQPLPITGCDANGCRDAAGNRYNGWGQGMIRSDGKLCQQIGNLMHCD